jgi:hypothetical protein
MRAGKWIAAGCVALSLVACGGGGGGGGGGGPDLSVSPKTQTVTAGGAGITFTATLTGATDTISWTLTGAGGISAATGATTTYTPPATAASSSTATLTATAGSLTDSAVITINPPASITVSGRVLAANGMPIASSSVVIGAQSAITASDGTFTIHNVTTPYDLVSVVSTPSKLGVVYKGLTRTDPVILHMGLTPALPYSGTVSGNVSPAPAGKTYVAWGSPETAKNTGNLTVNPYTLSLSWMGATSTTGNLHGLKWHPASGLPTGYDGYGSLTGVTVANSGTTAGQNISLTAVTGGHVDGTVTVPASYTLFGKTANVVFADGATIPVVSDLTATTTFNYLTPASVGGTITLVAAATGTDGLTGVGKTGLNPNTTGLVLAPQACPPLGLPADNGTGITNATSFTWGTFAGGIFAVSFAPAVGTDPAYWVFTADTSTTIPDLSALGLALPAGSASYDWNVIAVAPWASVDALAGGHSIVPSGDTYYEAIGAGRTFTTE